MSSAQTPPTAPLRALTPQVVAAYRELLDAQWPRVRAELEALAAIPSVSLAGYDPGPVERSAQQVAELLADAGMQAEVVRAGGGHPAVIARIPPPKGDPAPDRTNPDFCEYDEPTKSYRYTKAYVNHLIKKCGTAEGFEEITGMAARSKDEGGSQIAPSASG